MLRVSGFRLGCVRFGPPVFERGVRRGRCRVIPASVSHSVSSDLLFTELPFALVSVAFALVAIDGSQAPRPWLREAVLFALASAGFLLRTAGMALFAAWVLEALARRHRW